MVKESLPSISRRNNMNVVRCYLALSVIARHFNVLTGEHIAWPTDYYATGSIGGFFALSGFLAFRSYISKGCSPRAYFINRARRLMPMYLFIIIACALGLSLVSTLSPGDYFTSWQFWKYLLANACFLNFLEPSLPGVFEGREFLISPVNGAIWTMKVDLLLTLSVPLVHYLYSRLHLDKARLFGAIIAVSIMYRAMFSWLYMSTGSNIYEILGRQFFGQFAYFYVGVAICYFYDGFMSHKRAVLTVTLPVFALSKFIPYYNAWLDPIVFAPLVIWVSMVGSWGYRISRSDNLSYGMYLYHFPVIQLAIYLGIKQLPLWPAFLIIVTVTALLALAAWHFIGKRFVTSSKNTA